MVTWDRRDLLENLDLLVLLVLLVLPLQPWKTSLVVLKIMMLVLHPQSSVRMKLIPKVTQPACSKLTLEFRLH